MKTLNPNTLQISPHMVSSNITAESLVTLQEDIKSGDKSNDFQESSWTTQALGVVLGILALLLLSKISRWQSKRLHH